MWKTFTRLVCLIMLVLTSQATFAQNITVSGNIRDKVTGDPLVGVAITVKGKAKGTLSNERGDFKLTTNENTPFVITFSYIGYQSIEQTINNSVNDLLIQLDEQAVLGQEVVVAASRTPERILESPVSIERVGATAVRESATPSFYDALVNLKGVESSTQSLTFRSLNTRGFNSNGNVRFNQYIDGMDNQAPGLNFSVGNIVGISDLDVESAELVPGASSALYGAGGTNGSLIMTSKSPFNHQGLAFSYKVGLNHVDSWQRSAASFEDMSLRYAKAWNNKFALKTNISYIDANDWQTMNYDNFDAFKGVYKAGTRATDPNYNGVNVYGDEINNTFINNLPVIGANYGYLNGQTVSRTGYNEYDLVDYGTKGFKTSNSLHYRFGNGMELIGQANWGTGTSVYTGTARYSLKNFKIGQYKLELKSDNFFVRAYTTQESSGDSYQTQALASLINEAWKPSRTAWFPQYVQVYNQARMNLQSDARSHELAREAADNGRLLPGMPRYEALKADIITRPIGTNSRGAKFQDHSALYHGEAMYNFTNMLDKKVELIAGGSYRLYDLNSGGTLFDDATSHISIYEFGGYLQVAKKLFDDKLKLTASGRFDKSQNFEGRVTPRVSAVYTVARNNNIRVSYQTGFRNPTTQNQYINLWATDQLWIIGGTPELLDKHQLRTQPAYTKGSVAQYQAAVAMGVPGATAAGLLKAHTFTDFKPESVQAYEIGYKGLLMSKLLVDVSYYYSSFKDYILQLDVVKLTGPAPVQYSTVINSPDKVNMQGIALGLDYRIGKFKVSANGTYNDLVNTDQSVVTDFNTPKYRFNVGLSSQEIVKNIGFNAVYRWQDQFTWNSTFVTGTVPAYGTLDAQVSYKFPEYSSSLKIGASNLLNQYYVTSYGNPSVGGMYYVSLVFDQVFKK